MCNNDLGYYEKGYEEVRSDKFVNCYRDLGGHYLYNNKYYQCYESCKNCIEEGYHHNHNPSRPSRQHQSDKDLRHGPIRDHEG